MIECIGLMWWQLILILWGYVIVGFALDALWCKKDKSEIFPHPLLWVIWPFVVVVLIILAPFFIIARLFDV